MDKALCVQMSEAKTDITSLRAILKKKPPKLGPNKTLTEIWHFRLKGAPAGIYERAAAYYYHVNSPSTMVNADDLNNFRAIQEGLGQVGGGDWVSLHRNAGQDTNADDVTRSVTGMSEMPMRNMFSAWKQFMTEGERG